MKRIIFPLFALVLASTGVASAQQLMLPQPSPHAVVVQTVGVTDVTIDYSSPGLKGRKPFGTLVPYGQLWRAGANASTKLTFSTDVIIADKPLAAGTYSLFFIPTAKTWTVVINKNKDAQNNNYDEKQDALRFEVKTEKAPKRERLTYIFSNTSETDARIDMEWDEIRVSIPVKTDTAKLAAGGIDSHVGGAWRPLANAARYYNDAKDPAKAMELINASIAVKETWFNVWIKAQFLANAGNFKDAYPLAQKAHDLGTKDTFFFWKADVEKALAEWKLKI